MENERRFAIKSVRTLEETYQKYDSERISHIKINIILMLSNLAIVVAHAAFGTDNPALTTATFGNAALVVSNAWMLMNTSKNIERTSNSLNEAYDELNIPEEERVIDHEGRSK